MNQWSRGKETHSSVALSARIKWKNTVKFSKENSFESKIL